MTTTDDSPERPAQTSIEHRGLWRRLLVAVAAIIIFAVVALALAALVPDGLWPAIGDGEYSPGQASVVPALNLFPVGAIALALLHPALSASARIVLDVLLGIAVAAAGPALAVVSGETATAGLAAPGVFALAAAGIAIGLARTSVTQHGGTPPTTGVGPAEAASSAGAASHRRG